MGNIFEQIRRSEDCPVRNCKIGVSLECHPQEIQQAIQFGKQEIKRNASYRQRNPSITGCQNYSLEHVEIIYDEEGNAIDYVMPYTDPDQILDFTLVAGLVKYGTDLQGVFTAVHDKPSGEGKWQELQDNFDNLLYSAQQANRHFFPPDKIMVEEKPYEVAAVNVCDNSSCIYNSGKAHIDPLPMVAK